MTKFQWKGLLILLIAALPSVTFAQETLSSGNTAWILTALVLFMTIPGLSFFYAGTQQKCLIRFDAMPA